MHPTGADFNLTSPGVPIFSSPDGFATPGVKSNEEAMYGESEACGQTARKEGYGVESSQRTDSQDLQPSIGAKTERRSHRRTGRTDRSDATTGVTGEQSQPAERQTGERRSWRALASRFIRREEPLPVQAPFHHTPLTLRGLLVELETLGTIHERESVPPQHAAPPTPAVLPQAPKTELPASPFKPTKPLQGMEEICAQIVCRLVPEVTYLAIWDLAEIHKKLCLFQHNLTGSTLALPISELCVSAIRRKVRETDQKFFGHGELDEHAAMSL